MCVVIKKNLIYAASKIHRPVQYSAKYLLWDVWESMDERV